MIIGEKDNFQWRYRFISMFLIREIYIITRDWSTTDLYPFHGISQFEGKIEEDRNSGYDYAAMLRRFTRKWRHDKSVVSRSIVVRGTGTLYTTDPLPPMGVYSASLRDLEGSNRSIRSKILHDAVPQFLFSAWITARLARWILFD